MAPPQVPARGADRVDRERGAGIRARRPSARAQVRARRSRPPSDRRPGATSPRIHCVRRRRCASNARSRGLHAETLRARRRAARARSARRRHSPRRRASRRAARARHAANRSTHRVSCRVRWHRMRPSRTPRSSAHFTRVLPMSMSRIIRRLAPDTSPEMNRCTPAGVSTSSAPCASMPRATPRVISPAFSTRTSRSCSASQSCQLGQVRREPVARKSLERGHEPREQRRDDAIAIRHRRAMRADVVGDVARGLHGRRARRRRAAR